MARGPSIATPTFASIVALLNDARLKAGLSTLGFINPLLYAISEKKPYGFNEVSGHNVVCDSEGYPVGIHNPLRLNSCLK